MVVVTVDVLAVCTSISIISFVSGDGFDFAVRWFVMIYDTINKLRDHKFLGIVKVSPFLSTSFVVSIFECVYSIVIDRFEYP